MSKIITLGELLIDLTQQGTDENGNGKFVAYPGGAPANVAVAASRLGAETAFIGKVGDDAFGRSLADTLQKDNVDISGLYYSETTPTTMAIVSVDENGERDFSFYRKPGADIMLTGDESVSAVRKHADKGARTHLQEKPASLLLNLPKKRECSSATTRTTEPRSGTAKNRRFRR